MDIVDKNYYLKRSFIFIFLYWLIDSSIHFFVFDEVIFEIIPSEINELWMRCMITILLIVFAIFADKHAKKVAQKEQEKTEVYISMLNANQHILNNFLQSMMLFRGAAEASSDIDEEIVKLYDKTIKNTMMQINNLHGIQEPSKSTIEDRFLPK